MTTYSRYATCSEGHRIEVSFEWDPHGRDAAKEYSKPCPVFGCNGRLEGKLPIGANFSTLVLSEARQA